MRLASGHFYGLVLRTRQVMQIRLIESRYFPNSGFSAHTLTGRLLS